ncbi:unnamed protein product [Peronospora destructor]|uniref:Protein kinase domain-containing protein n=1 Tax=Peronospora destructor TaxID=86335 RepID=A0AAV0SZS8_9STRA|nr:unnamed protein product [Peronospora destructor]
MTGLLAFLTCGACTSRRKRRHQNFPDTITISTASGQPHHGGRRDRRSSNPRPRVSSGPNSGLSSGPEKMSSGPQRPRNGSRPQPYQPQHPEQRHSRPQQQRYDRLAVHGNSEPVSKPQSGDSSNSANDRDLEITDKSREATIRVLEQFQADPTLGKSRVPYSSLYFTRVLSKGAFGEVWLAQLENRQVAVKRILNEKKNDEKEIECFGAEIKLMASFSHSKIVEFVGVSWSSMQDVCAVTEYMSKGDLHGFLKRRQGQLNWRDHKIFLAEDVADALGYLHDKRDSSGKKLQSMKIVQMVIRRNMRPTFSPECPALVKELVNRCLDSDPDVRPSAMELLRIIQRMQNLL